MMAKSDATVSVGADGSAFSATMRSISKDVDTMANSATARFARLGDAIEGLGKIGSGLRNTLGGFLAPAAEREDAAAMLGIMMRSGDAAEYLAGRLQLMAANGVRGMDELTGAARALTNIYSDADSIERWVGVMADVAAGSKVTTDRLAEMAARIDDMGQAEFTELSNAGIPIFEELGAVMGKTQQEVVAAMQQRKISVDDYLQALARLTSETGKYHGLNSRLSNTSKGSWNTLKASIEACMGELGKPVNNALRPLLQELSAQLQEIMPELEAFGSRFGAHFVRAAQDVMPLVRGLGDMVVRLTEWYRVVGMAAAGWLVYAANAHRAAAASFSFVGVLGRVGAALRGLNLRAAFSGWQGILAGAQRSMRAFGAGMVTTWKSMCITFATSFKAAMVAVKSALISTGIGALIWAAGEGVAWLYRQVAGVDDAQEAAASSARDWADEMERLRRAAENVRNVSDRQAVTEGAAELRQRIEREQAAAASAGDDAMMESAQAALHALNQWEKVAQAQMKASVQATEQATREAAARREAAAAAEQQRQEDEARLKTIQQMKQARLDDEFEERMDDLRDRPEGLGGGSDVVIRERLGRVQAQSVEALYEERSALEALAAPTQEQLTRYQAIAATIRKIEEEQAKAAEKEKDAANERARSLESYYERRRSYNEGREQERYEAMSIPAQEKYLKQEARSSGYWGEMSREGIRGQMDKLAEADATGNERQIEALEKILTMYDKLVERKKRFAETSARDRQELRIQALEATGQQKQADALRSEMEMQERVAELQSQGATKKQATRQARMEQAVKGVQEARSKMGQSQMVQYQGQRVGIGGGGANVRFGTSQVQEMKKQSSLLKEIRDWLKDNGGSDSTAVAVLG